MLRITHYFFMVKELECTLHPKNQVKNVAYCSAATRCDSRGTFVGAVKHWKLRAGPPMCLSAVSLMRGAFFCEGLQVDDGVGFVDNFSGEDFEDVFEGDDAGDAAVFVGDDGEMLAELLKGDE